MGLGSPHFFRLKAIVKTMLPRVDTLRVEKLIAGVFKKILKKNGWVQTSRCWYVRDLDELFQAFYVMKGRFAPIFGTGLLIEIRRDQVAFDLKLADVQFLTESRYGNLSALDNALDSRVSMPDDERILIIEGYIQEVLVPLSNKTCSLAQLKDVIVSGEPRSLVYRSAYDYFKLPHPEAD
jgi:hypothetical protein